MKLFHFHFLLLVSLTSCVMPPQAYYHGPPPRRRLAADRPHPSSPWAAPRDYAAYHRAIGEPAAGTLLDGDVTAMPSGDRVYRDRRSGRIVGSASTSPAGTTTYRDADGRITGNSAASHSGRTTHRDANGRITLTSDASQGTGGDSTMTYRRNGEIVGQRYVSPAGNVTWRDGSGRIIDGPGGFKP